VDIFGLQASLFVNGGAVTLLGLTVWLVFTGRLVPRSTVEDLRADRDNWRDAALAKEETRQVEAEQSRLVLDELAQTVDRFISSLPPPAGDRRQLPRGGGRT
jgi:hypothetical protein